MSDEKTTDLNIRFGCGCEFRFILMEWPDWTVVGGSPCSAHRDVVTYPGRPAGLGDLVTAILMSMTFTPRQENGG